jgi:hypothetical protein
MLARTLVDVGQTDEAIEALSGAPVDAAGPPVDYEHARLLGMVGRVDEAVALASRHARSLSHARLALRLLVKHGRHAEAAAYERIVAAAAPSDSSLIDLRATRLRRDPGAVLAVCDEALAHQPGCGQAIYYKIIALAQLGRGEEARS